VARTKKMSQLVTFYIIGVFFSLGGIYRQIISYRISTLPIHRYRDPIIHIGRTLICSIRGKLYASKLPTTCIKQATIRTKTERDIFSYQGASICLNEFLKVLRVQGARMGLEINLKKTKSAFEHFSSGLST